MGTDIVFDDDLFAPLVATLVAMSHPPTDTSKAVRTDSGASSSSSSSDRRAINAGVRQGKKGKDEAPHREGTEVSHSSNPRTLYSRQLRVFSLLS